MSKCNILSEVYTRTSFVNTFFEILSLGSRTFPGSTHIAMNQGSLAAQTIAHHNQKYLEKKHNKIGMNKMS